VGISPTPAQDFFWASAACDPEASVEAEKKSALVPVGDFVKFMKKNHFPFNFFISIYSFCIFILFSFLD
jgi:hypothetical protein